MKAEPETNSPFNKPDQRRQPAPTMARLKGGLLGAGLAVFCLAVIWFVFMRPQQREITREDFEAAKSRWESAGVTDYDLEVKVSGRQPAVYTVEVRSGEVRQATHNGNPLKNERTKSTWTAPGMFGTMEVDVQNVERFASGKADRSTPQLLLLGFFDPEFGLPRRYHRIEKVKWGSNRDVMWEVIRFQPRR